MNKIIIYRKSQMIAGVFKISINDVYCGDLMNGEKKEFTFPEEIKKVSIQAKTFSTYFNVSNDDLKSEVFHVSFNRLRARPEVYAGNKLLTSNTKANHVYLIIPVVLFIISLLLFFLSQYV